MEVKTLQEKVKKAQEKVEKCVKTVKRHQGKLEKKITALVKLGYSREQIKNNIDSVKWPVKGQPGGEHYWEACEIESKLRDIKGAKKKLNDAAQILSNWKEKLNKEIARDNLVQNNAPEAIVKFLENWKEIAYAWYIKRYEEVHDLKIELNKKVMKAEAEWVKNGNSQSYSMKNKFLKEKELDSKSIKDIISRKAGNAIVLIMLSIKNDKERVDYLNDTLEVDKRLKLIDLICRVNEAVGEIKDAEGLCVNEKGNLDGFIIGEKGKARLNTIGAGGWNVQVFHYRTLVHKIEGGN